MELASGYIHEFSASDQTVHPGSAFFILHHSLLEKNLLRRLAYVCAAAAGSLLFSWAGPNSAYGLCGLSGTAHGLMAISALELVSTQSPHSPEGRVGLGAFYFVVGKAAYEAVTGHMFFAFLDFGLLGNPISVAHAGGIIGALAIMLLSRFPCRQLAKVRLALIQGPRRG